MVLQRRAWQASNARRAGSEPRFETMWMTDEELLLADQSKAGGRQDAHVPMRHAAVVDPVVAMVADRARLGRRESG